MKDETVYVVQQNADTGAIELVAVSVVDERGKAVFTTDSTEVLTVTTSLPEGFISTAREENKATYYVNERGNFKKDGWKVSQVIGITLMKKMVKCCENVGERVQRIGTSWELMARC